MWAPANGECRSKKDGCEGAARYEKLFNSYRPTGYQPAPANYETHFDKAICSDYTSTNNGKREIDKTYDYGKTKNQ